MKLYLSFEIITAYRDESYENISEYVKNLRKNNEKINIRLTKYPATKLNFKRLYNE
jgi:hypothetical protein